MEKEEKLKRKLLWSTLNEAVVLLQRVSLVRFLEVTTRSVCLSLGKSRHLCWLLLWERKKAWKTPQFDQQRKTEKQSQQQGQKQQQRRKRKAKRVCEPEVQRQVVACCHELFLQRSSLAQKERGLMTMAATPFLALALRGWRSRRWLW